MTINPEELVKYGNLVQIKLIDRILAATQKHTYVDEKENSIRLHDQAFIDEIRVMGEDLKATYFP